MGLPLYSGLGGPTACNYIKQKLLTSKINLKQAGITPNRIEYRGFYQTAMYY